jgi:hypothetical protein
MEPFDYYTDRKYCPACDDYVPYLVSIEHSYCADCGSVVRLFSKEDWSQFNESLSERKARGGRPRKDRGKESA